MSGMVPGGAGFLAFSSVPYLVNIIYIVDGVATWVNASPNLRVCLFLMHPKGLPWGNPLYPDLANKLIHKMRG